ncbi:hypothetical protein XA68_11942 [Ophiocordyceps unilateralis]|uniref:Anaphase-promoting complex subunit 11 n=1 Tax=Ophiocordyceps unilateralis TaxID=268505 RepID=A0A2A9PFN9_OPHUN|nr:hypothetical protein XA68_11942 [Ophiocordyceps unilateralis]
MAALRLEHKRLRAGSSRERPIDLCNSSDDDDDGDNDAPPAKKQHLAGDNSNKQAATSEKRLRKFRTHPPQSFDVLYDRALSQRFCVLERIRGGDAECPEETVLLAGSTGNVYTVHIGREPRCDCPHALRGNQCKHVLYVLERVLQAPFELVYQLALLSSELRTIFATAWRVDARSSCGPEETPDGVRRKTLEGDCPICYCELETRAPESVVWCRAACGQNMHRACLDMWAEKSISLVSCPMCRSPWKEENEDGDAPVEVGPRSRAWIEEGVASEGYANVAHRLGISTARDTSSYSRWYRDPGSRDEWW